MLTIDALRQFGADPQDGLGRCLNNEAIYLRLVSMALDDVNFGKLSDAVAAGDKKSSFEAVHAIKGVMANLGLTPLYKLSSEMTELLRTGQDADYPAYLSRLLDMRDRLLSLREG